jgi:hypothetical protein
VKPHGDNSLDPILSKTQKFKEAAKMKGWGADPLLEIPKGPDLKVVALNERDAIKQRKECQGTLVVR